ncbi:MULTISPECIES: bis(5'-nucleosyl)-tetraphosphatase PrpE [unclassified Bacillus (in: firmicutes)]|uniref:bis(5'-nucleosyl)-tetraphosphatase PrpE n=1 Tax=unclassified Bacillus (in: firmicutes) TaxID=185979 RepID=UPI0008ED475C|nr:MULTISPECIES: bis(5'-nucleosyl)-tetraphosphatase PrpE [unclassified Bacillus (in: firmicutes)]SFA78382.1 protein phosphatase [Bacillus sp. UNCCL13]SFQ68332.1 protein phosphatase [Bacillus sp. cl95]
MNIDIIGDIHGCFDEFKTLTEELGYKWDTGIPVHPDGRLLGFVGDLTDRGPASLKVAEIVSKLVSNKKAYYTPGNHCNKLYRFFLGNKVQETHGLETTAAEYRALPKKEQNKISNDFIRLYENSPLYHLLDDGKLVIAHAGIRHDYIGRNDAKVKTFVLYGDITGEKHPDGRPVRRDWTLNYSGNVIVVYGHTPVIEAKIYKNTYNIDTGAVFGGKLSALRYPEMEIVSVPSSMPYVAEKFREDK